MAKLRKAVAYRRIERPYTRVSKYRKKSFIRARPNLKIVRYVMGNLSGDFDTQLVLKSTVDLQIRHNAIESARLSSNRLVEKNLGKQNYRMQIRIYPHHVLRENPLASGAGADRMSTGMKMSFGKVIGAAAQVKKDQIIFTLDVNKKDLETAKKSLQRAAHKFPCTCKIEIIEKK